MVHAITTSAPRRGLPGQVSKSEKEHRRERPNQEGRNQGEGPFKESEMRAVALSILTAACLLASVVKITPDEFVVKPRVARSFSFTVNGGVQKLVGNFRASGGAHNDIRVVITNSDGCENWLNGNRASLYYDSGAETVGNFDVNLAPA